MVVPAGKYFDYTERFSCIEKEMKFGGLSGCRRGDRAAVCHNAA